MTKQNRIHKLMVVREKDCKELRNSLSGIPNTYYDEKYLINVKRRRTYVRAFFKRLPKYEGRIL